MKNISDEDHICSEYERAYKMATNSYNGCTSFHVEGLEDIHLYLRVFTGKFARFGRPVAIISSIDIDSDLCGTGVFSSLLRRLQSLCRKHDWVLEVENVVNQRFFEYLLRQGFIDPNDPTGSNYGYQSLYWKHWETTQDII